MPAFRVKNIMKIFTKVSLRSGSKLAISEGSEV